MIVDLRSILHFPRHFDLTLDEDWWRGEGEYDQIMGLDGPLVAYLTISEAGGTKYLLDGRLVGRLRIGCDRCLEPFLYDLDGDFRLFLAPGPVDTAQSEAELLKDDLSADFITGGQIDLDEIVREQIYLSLPMKFLCQEDCSGLCPGCGTNLNKTRCECQQEKGHPGFSKLKEMKIEGD